MSEIIACQHCGENFERPSMGRKDVRFCSDRCRKAENRYTAENIKIMPASAAEEKWDWLKIEQLAAEYNRDPKWISRGLRACAQAGVPSAYFIERYLHGVCGEPNEEVPMHEGVDAAFREIHIAECR